MSRGRVSEDRRGFRFAVGVFLCGALLGLPSAVAGAAISDTERREPLPLSPWPTAAIADRLPYEGEAASIPPAALSAYQEGADLRVVELLEPQAAEGRLSEEGSYLLGLARLHLGDREADHYNKAREVFTLLAQKATHPERKARALSALGETYLRMRFAEEALAQFSRVPPLRPGPGQEWTARRGMARALYLAGHYREAARAFRQVIEGGLPPGDALPLFWLANALHRIGAREEAERYYRLGEVYGPDYPRRHPYSLALLAENAVALKEPDRARRSYLRLANLFPREPWSASALFRAGELAVRQGKRREAEKILNRVLEIYEKDPQAIEAILRSRLALADLRQKEAPAEARATYETIARGDHGQGAVTRLALQRLAQRHLAEGQHREALALLARQGTPDPGFAAQAFVGAARALIRQGEAGEVLALYETYRALLPAHPAGQAEVLWTLGEAYRLLGRHTEALDHYRRIARTAGGGGAIDPAQVYLRLGESALALGDERTARESLGRLIVKFPAATEVVEARRILRSLEERRVLLGGTEDPAHREAEYRRIFQREGSPLRAEAGMRLGDLLFQGGRHEEALAVYRAIAERVQGEDRRWALYRIGGCHLARGEVEAAREAFDRLRKTLASEAGDAIWRAAVTEALEGVRLKSRIASVRERL